MSAENLKADDGLSERYKESLKEAAVVDEATRSRYEMVVEDETVFANYRRDGGTFYITHVEAPPVLRGTGAAGQLMRGMMEQLKAEGAKVVPICGYAAAWIQRHPEFHHMRF